MKNVLAIVLYVAMCHMASACTSTTSMQNTMAIQSPCVDTIISYNQKTAPSVTNVAVSDANLVISGSATFPVTIQAPGMKNVEVWTHGALAKRLTSDGVGGFTGTIDLSHEYEGPMHMRVFSWNSLPGDNSYTVQLSASFDMWVHNLSGKWYPLLTPKGAGTMHMVFNDRFGTLSATPCKPGTGVWPNCAKPTAADGFTYYENKPDSGGFGNAAFEHTDNTTVDACGPLNPYFLKTGFLRIRSTYCPSYVDPYGFNRHWRAGLVATAFPDGTSGLPPMTKGGYCEIRAMIPKGDASWNTSKSGGTWESFWMLDRDAITNRSIGNLEEDVFETYGVDGTFLNENEHSYSPVTGPNQAIYRGQPAPNKQDLSWEFHRYGILFTATTVTAYFDDVPLSTIAIGQFPGGKPYNPYLLIDMDQGGGWPSNPPPAGYNDLWIDRVSCYAP
jgi:Glycosyl hydrolases family 16